MFDDRPRGQIPIKRGKTVGILIHGFGIEYL